MVSVFLLLVEYPFYSIVTSTKSFFLFIGLPKTIELREIFKGEASSPSAKPSSSLQHTAEAATNKEEKTRKNRRSSGSSDAPAETKKKRVSVKVRKTTKKSTHARVPNPDSFYQLRDYPEDDDI